MIQEALPVDILKTREGRVKRSKENKRKAAQRRGDRDDGVSVGTSALPVCPEQLLIRIFFLTCHFFPVSLAKTPWYLGHSSVSGKRPQKPKDFK